MKGNTIIDTKGIRVTDWVLSPSHILRRKEKPGGRVAWVRLGDREWPDALEREARKIQEELELEDRA